MNENKLNAEGLRREDEAGAISQVRKLTADLAAANKMIDELRGANAALAHTIRVQAKVLTS